MDYAKYLEYEYTEDVDYLINSFYDDLDFYVFLRGGETYEITNYENPYNYMDFEHCCFYVSSQVRLNVVNGQVVAFICKGTDDNFYLINNSYIDYCVVGISGQPTLSVNAGRVHGDNSPLEDFDNINNYGEVNQNDIFSSYTYGSYVKNNLQNQSVVFDYSNLNYGTASYYSDVINIRGENTSYYKTNLMLTFSNADADLHYNYGRPLADMRNSEYARGSSAGYAGGYIDGYDNGFIAGQNSVGIDSRTATAFDVIGSGFSAVTSIMSIEVLPNITLGLCFSIPLTLILIMTIFKLVRK